MKLALATAILLLITGAAHADEFIIIKDGTQYTCAPSSVLNPGDAVACAEKAYAGPFNREQSMRLCTGATGLGPAECAIKAYSGPFNTEQSIELCARTGTIANADCAIRAYSGPYNATEAIALCKSNAAGLMLKGLAETTVDSRKVEQFKDRSLMNQMLIEKFNRSFVE